VPKYQTYLLNAREEIVGSERATHASDAAAFDRALDLLESCQMVDVLRGARRLRRMTRREYGLAAEPPFARRRFALFNASPTPKWLRA
jgi:hypothetical protein